MTMLRSVVLRAAAICIAAFPIAAQGQGRGGGAPDPLAAKIVANYTKREVRIPMRDGTKLFTSIYIPRDTTRRYPFMMTRTPYGVAPYGADKFPARLGRFMSEGYFQYMTPHIDVKRKPTDVDESSDTV